MLIKIRNTTTNYFPSYALGDAPLHTQEDSWVILDNIELVEYSDAVEMVSSNKEYDNFLEKNGMSNLVDGSYVLNYAAFDPEKDNFICWVRGFRDGKTIYILHTDVVYLCNDNGETIQKLGSTL